MESVSNLVSELLVSKLLARARDDGLVAGEPMRIRPAGHGTLNDMLAIEYADDRTLYWKRFLPHPDWPWVQSPQDRLRVETGALGAFRAALPAEIMLPAVIAVDEADPCILLSDACPVGGGNWQEAFLENNPEIGLPLAEQLGAALGALTRFVPERPLRTDMDAERAHWQNWIRLRTLDTLQHDPPVSPAARLALQRLYDEACACARPCLLHVDLNPKNFMVSREAVGLVDFELAAAIGDPTFDLGFFLGHVGLFLVNAGRAADRTWSAILDRIARSYLAAARLDRGKQQRLMRHAGAAMLYRVAGATRMPFLDPRAAARQLALADALLASPPALPDYGALLAGVR